MAFYLRLGSVVIVSSFPSGPGGRLLRMGGSCLSLGSRLHFGCLELIPGWRGAKLPVEWTFVGFWFSRSLTGGSIPIGGRLLPLGPVPEVPPYWGGAVAPLAGGTPPV